MFFFLLRRKKKKKIKHFHHFLFQQQKVSNILLEGSSQFCSHIWSYGRNWDHNRRFSQLLSSFKLVTFYHCRSYTELPQVTIKKISPRRGTMTWEIIGPQTNTMSLILLVLLFTTFLQLGIWLLVAKRLFDHTYKEKLISR